jgi:hypothetical protein
VFGLRFFDRGGRGALNPDELYPCGEIIDNDFMMTDDTRTADRRDQAEAEQQRRRQIRELLSALKIVRNPSFTGPGPNLAPAAGLGMDTNIQDFYTTLPDSKYAMIIEFIEKNRFILAFPTMHFPMAGHVLYTHMIRLGLQASYEQFRLFLSEAQRLKFLFTSVKIFTVDFEDVVADQPVSEELACHNYKTKLGSHILTQNGMSKYTQMNSLQHPLYENPTRFRTKRYSIGLLFAQRESWRSAGTLTTFKIRNGVISTLTVSIPYLES